MINRLILVAPVLLVCTLGLVWAVLEMVVSLTGLDDELEIKE